MRSLIAALCLLAITAPALADEVWTTEQGQIVYAEDIGEIAHWTFNYAHEGKSGVLDIYLPGLGGNFDQRGTHEGYFLIRGSNACGSVEWSPNGWSSGSWGSIVVVFDRPSFPSGFTIYAGTCLEPVDPEPLRAEPM